MNGPFEEECLRQSALVSSIEVETELSRESLRLAGTYDSYIDCQTMSTSCKQPPSVDWVQECSDALLVLNRCENLLAQLQVNIAISIQNLEPIRQSDIIEEN